jgi:hypothetical protein
MADAQLPPERPPTEPKPPEYPHPGGEPQPSWFKRWLKPWRDDAVSRRRFLLRIGVAAIVVIVPVSAILTALALTSKANTADRLAAAGDVLVGATLVLGFAAALVTLLAFMTTAGIPYLRLQLACECSKPNNPIFQADKSDNGTVQAGQSKQLSGRIVIWNDSYYPAREPRVIVRLNAMAFTAEPDCRFLDDWAVLDVIDTIGITAIEWEGGPGYSIHPGSVRRLPGFYLNNLRWKEGWENPGFIIEILLEKVRQVEYIPVGFDVNGKLLGLKEEDRGPVPPWRPPPPRKRKPGRPGSKVYTQLPDHEQERQASSGADV